MRSPRWLLSTLLLFPSLASAQVFVPPPPPLPLPPGVHIQQRIHWHVRRAAPQVVVTPPPVWVAPAAPPPPVYYSQPPLVHIEPQQPVYAQPQPVYQQPSCCVQVPPPPPVVTAPAPVVAAPVVVAQPAPAKPQWNARFGLGASVEGTFARGNDPTRGYGVLAQLRYRTSRHTALELMGGYQRSDFDNGLQRADVPITFGLLIPFLGPEHAFSPYLVGAVGLNFAQLRLVDTPGFRLDDSRLQGLAQVGGGFEVRLGQHLSLNTDARLEGRWNASDASPEVLNTVVKVDGQVVEPLRNSVGVRLGVGATVYF